MEITEAIALLKEQVPDPSAGLPDELFYYISQTTPLVNVDLLVKDKKGRILLAWRDDQFCGRGWHVPGGIIRFQETLETRLQAVAAKELGVASLDHDRAPLAVTEMIHPERAVRSHFISLLYQCRLPEDFTPHNRGLKPGDSGYLQWHEHCPDNLIKYHDKYYRQYL
jgi:ADP-ribose pyrophosphatase YjhB (NUDIX family)